MSEDVLFSFEKLRVYEVAQALVKEIYQLQKDFPHEVKYGLGDQVRRAAVSIVANIAEGGGRTFPKEKIHFIEIAFGSMTEVFCELQLACEFGYISQERFEDLRPKFTETAKLLSGLRNSLSKSLECKG